MLVVVLAIRVVLRLGRFILVRLYGNVLNVRRVVCMTWKPAGLFYNKVTDYSLLTVVLIVLGLLGRFVIVLVVAFLRRYVKILSICKVAAPSDRTVLRVSILLVVC